MLLEIRPNSVNIELAFGNLVTPSMTNLNLDFYYTDFAMLVSLLLTRDYFLRYLLEHNVGTLIKASLSDR